MDSIRRQIEPKPEVGTEGSQTLCCAGSFCFRAYLFQGQECLQMINVEAHATHRMTDGKKINNTWQSILLVVVGDFTLSTSAKFVAYLVPTSSFSAQTRMSALFKGLKSCRKCQGSPDRFIRYHPNWFLPLWTRVVLLYTSLQVFCTTALLLRMCVCFLSLRT